MTAKPSRYLWIVLLALLTACGTTPQTAETTKVQNTALAMARTGVALTQTAMPTSTPAATPIPTEPPPLVFTPDAIQVERWQEYQLELAKVVIYGYRYGPDIYKNALCEWDILGRSGQEVYVWAFCASQEEVWGDRPAVIHLDADGAVQKVSAPAINNSTWDSQIQKMFPAEVQEKFDLYTGNSSFYGRLREMINHNNYRETHPEEPPLAVLSAMPKVTITPSPIPTQPPLPHPHT